MGIKGRAKRLRERLAKEEAEAEAKMLAKRERGGEFDDDEDDDFYDDEEGEEGYPPHYDDEDDEDDDDEPQMPKLKKSEMYDMQDSDYLERVQEEHKNRRSSHIKKKQRREDDDGAGVAVLGASHAAEELMTKPLSKAAEKAVVTGVSFSHPLLALNPVLRDALDREGFSRMTPIQQRSIPLALNGDHDILGQAKTGSGKTLAFGIPMLHGCIPRLESRANLCVGLVIAPTKELCVQIHSVLAGVVKHITHVGIKVQLITGGTKVTQERKELRNANIVVGTPGRIHDHVKNSTADWELRSIMCFVLDEADRMLAEGFQIDLDAIVSRLPSSRQTMLFSATNSKSVRELARLSLSRHPLIVSTKDDAPKSIEMDSTVSLPQVSYPVFTEVESEAADADAEATPAGVDAESVPTKLLQYCQVVEMPDRLRALYVFCKGIVKHKNKAMVFCSTIASTTFHCMMMGSVGFHDEVLMLHGKMKHRQRLAGFDEFLRRDSGILFCTDVAARGLDIPHIDWVLQFDPPLDPTEYIHRIGRTARAGAAGNALIFLTPQEQRFIPYLKRFGLSLEQYVVPPLPDVQLKLEHVLQLDAGVAKAADSAMRAYVGAYQSHTLRDVFDVQQLELDEVAMSFALTTMPKISLPTNTDAAEKAEFVKGKLKSLNKKKQSAMRMFQQEKTKQQWSDDGVFVGFRKPSA